MTPAPTSIPAARRHSARQTSKQEAKRHAAAAAAAAAAEAAAAKTTTPQPPRLSTAAAAAPATASAATIPEALMPGAAGARGAPEQRVTAEVAQRKPEALDPVARACKHTTKKEMVRMLKVRASGGRWVGVGSRSAGS